MPRLSTLPLRDGVLLAVVVLAPRPARAEAILPDALFLSPSSFFEGIYPEAIATGGEPGVPWALQWSTKDILALDPTRKDVSIVGLAILPILRPDAASEEGAYGQDDLAAITIDNYAQHFALLPGLDVYALDCDYDADLTGDLLTVHVATPGPFVFRIDTISRPAADAALEPVSYTVTALLGDAYSVRPVDDIVPFALQRVLGLEQLEGPELSPPDGPGPSSTVHVVSDDGTRAMNNAIAILAQQGKEAKKVKTVDELVQAVCDAQMAYGAKVKLIVHAHGGGPANSQPGSFALGSSDGVSQKAGWGSVTPRQLGDMLRGKVREIVLASCYAGSDPAFMASLADSSGVFVTGFSVATSSSFSWIFFGTGYFDVAAAGKRVIAAPKPCASPAAGPDVDGDGQVGGADLGLMLRWWGGAGCGDLNDDGVVDGADLGLLFAAWTEC